MGNFYTPGEERARDKSQQGPRKDTPKRGNSFTTKDAENEQIKLMSNSNLDPKGRELMRMMSVSSDDTHVVLQDQENPWTWAKKIKTALLEGWFSEDEEGALNQIRGKSLAEKMAIRKNYEQITNGRKLESDFKDYCNDDQAKEAYELLTPAMSLYDQLKYHVNWYNAEEHVILEILKNTSNSSPEKVRAFRLEEDGLTFDEKCAWLYGFLNDDEYYNARRLLLGEHPDKKPYKLTKASIKISTSNENDVENKIYGPELSLAEQYELEQYNITKEYIKNAAGYFNDDENRVYNALLELPAKLRQKLWDDDRAIFSFIDGYNNSEDPEEGTQMASIQKLCTGSEAEMLKERMFIATSGWGTDEAAVGNVMRKLSKMENSQEKQELLSGSENIEGYGGESFLEMLDGDVGDEAYLDYLKKGGASEYDIAKEMILRSRDILNMGLNKDTVKLGDAILRQHLGSNRTFWRSIDEETIYKAFELLQDQKSRDKLFADPEIKRIVDQLDDGTLRMIFGTALNIISNKINPKPNNFIINYLKEQTINALPKDEKSLLNSYQQGNSYKIALHKLTEAFEGMNIDEVGIINILASLSIEDKQKIKDEKPEIWTKILNSSFVDKVSHSENPDIQWNTYRLSFIGEQEKSIMKTIINDGRFPTEEALNYALGDKESNDGTIEEMLDVIFEHISEEERREFRLGYYLSQCGGEISTEGLNKEEEALKEKEAQAAKQKFKKLDERLLGDLNGKFGDDYNKYLDQLLGMPKWDELSTEKGRKQAVAIFRQRAKDKDAIREDDRSMGWVNYAIQANPLISSSVIGVYQSLRMASILYCTNEAEVSEQAGISYYGLLEEALQDGVIDLNEYAELAMLHANYNEKYQNYVNEVEFIANVGATAAAIAVGIIATIVSGGGGSVSLPVFLGSIWSKTTVGAFVAGGIANVATNEAMSGNHYDLISKEALEDFVNGGVESYTAVLMAKIPTGLGQNELVHLVFEGASVGIINETIIIAFNEETWNKGIMEAMGNFVTGGLNGGLMGAGASLPFGVGLAGLKKISGKVLGKLIGKKGGKGLDKIDEVVEQFDNSIQKPVNEIPNVQKRHSEVNSDGSKLKDGDNVDTISNQSINKLEVTDNLIRKNLVAFDKKLEKNYKLAFNNYSDLSENQKLKFFQDFGVNANALSIFNEEPYLIPIWNKLDRSQNRTDTDFLKFFNSSVTIASRKIIEDSGIQKKFPGISIEELTTIYHYTTSAYYDLNKALRNKDLLTSQLLGFNSALNKSLDKLPKYKSPTYRGTKLNDKLLSKYKFAFENTAEITEEAFTSSSTNSDVALGFGNQKLQGDEAKVFFTIEGKNGVKIDDISHYGPTFNSNYSESEVLFRSGLKFKVTFFEESIDLYNDRIVSITLKEK